MGRPKKANQEKLQPQSTDHRRPPTQCDGQRLNMGFFSWLGWRSKKTNKKKHSATNSEEIVPEYAAIRGAIQKKHSIASIKSRESREACYVGQEISSKSYNWRKSSAANASQYNDTGVGRSDMTEISFELMNRKMGTEYEGITKTVEFKGVNLAEMNKEERKQFFERDSRRDSHQSVRRSSSSGSGRERRISQSEKLPRRNRRLSERQVPQLATRENLERSRTRDSTRSSQRTSLSQSGGYDSNPETQRRESRQLSRRSSTKPAEKL